MRRTLGALAMVAATSAFLPSPASATVTCSFDSGPNLLTVNMTSATDAPSLNVNPVSSKVAVSGAGVSDPGTCSDLPETNKVTRIEVLQPGSNQDGRVAIQTGTPFAPGSGDPLEGAGAPELEISLDLGTGSDHVDLVMGDGADEIRLGALAAGPSGINLNVGAEATGPDGDDVCMAGVESITIFAGSAGSDGDVVDGRGGPEFAAALPLAMNVAGSEGDDTLSAGSAGSFIDGHGGDDTLRGGPANDTLRGNAGRDTLSYDGASSGVTVNLTTSTAQSTGGGGVDTLDHAGDPDPDIEDLIGSPFADILIGSDAANRIVGGEGVDTIAALDGADEVLLDDGAAGDRADCGPGADSARADALGAVALDTIANCEALALTDRTPPVSPTPSPRPGGGGPDPAPKADTTPPKLRLSVRKKQKAGSLTVRATCLDEACSVRGSGAATIVGVAKKQRLHSRPVRLAKGTSGTLRLKLSRQAKRAVQLALRDGKRVSALIAVRARDAAGNTATRKRAVSLR